MSVRRQRWQGTLIRGFISRCRLIAGGRRILWRLPDRQAARRDQATQSDGCKRDAMEAVREFRETHVDGPFGDELTPIALPCHGRPKYHFRLEAVKKSHSSRHPLPG